MAITINTNVTSLIAQRNLNNAQSGLSQSMERLSSGLRINSAKDDAAGLAIANLMELKSSSLEVATRNANDGISVLQVTGGILDEIENNLSRMYDLAVQASSGQYDEANRTALNNEFISLREEIDRVAKKTEFNGFKLTDGSTTNIEIQVGSGNVSEDRISIELINARISALGIADSYISTVDSARSAIDSIECAINKISVARSDLGTGESRLLTAINSNTNEIEKMASAISRIKDLDFADEISSMTKNNILVQAGTSMLAQANVIPELALVLLAKYQN